MSYYEKAKKINNLCKKLLSIGFLVKTNFDFKTGEIVVTIKGKPKL